MWPRANRPVIRRSASKRRVWRSASIAALFLVSVLTYPKLQQRFGTDSPQSSGETTARLPDADGTTWSIDIRPANRSSTTSQDQSAEASTQFLREIRTNVFESPAGLVFGPGSEEGHRLKHIMRHARDDPSRPGPHGVFDGGQSQILAILDEAWLLGKQGGPNVRTRQEDQRTILTVNLRRRVGYVGGETGRRQGNPSAHHVQLVLEDVNVITAFPLRP